MSGLNGTPMGANVTTKLTRTGLMHRESKAKEIAVVLVACPEPHIIPATQAVQRFDSCESRCSNLRRAENTLVVRSRQGGSRGFGCVSRVVPHVR